jgi:hypothetical protein
MVQTTLAEPGGKSWPKHISIARGKTNGRGLAPRRELIRGKQHTEKLFAAKPAKFRFGGDNNSRGQRFALRHKVLCLTKFR